jgi:hypothetical protein
MTSSLQNAALGSRRWAARKAQADSTRLREFDVLAGSSLAFAIAMAVRIPLTMTVEAKLPALSLKYQLYPCIILLRGRGPESPTFHGAMVHPGVQHSYT